MKSMMKRKGKYRRKRERGERERVNKLGKERENIEEGEER